MITLLVYIYIHRMYSVYIYMHINMNRKTLSQAFLASLFGPYEKFDFCSLMVGEQSKSSSSKNRNRDSVVVVVVEVVVVVVVPGGSGLSNYV